MVVFKQELDELKQKVINTAVLAAALTYLPGALLSLLRIFYFGWLNVFYLHIFLVLFAIGLLIFRKKANYSVIIHVLTVMVLIVSFATLINFSFTGAAFILFAVNFLPLILYSKRLALAYSVLYFMGYFTIAILHEVSFLTDAVDFDEYMDDLFMWFAHGFFYAIALSYLGYMLNLYYVLYIKAIKRVVDYSTELQDTLKKVRYQNNQFTSFMDAYPFHVSIKDQNQEYVFGNKSLLNLAGVKRDEFVGMTARDVFSNDIVKLMDQMDLRVVGKRELVKEKVSVKLENDEVEYYDVIKFPLFNEKDEVLVGAISINITRQENAEKKLIQSEKRYRSIFEGSVDGIVFHDENLNVIDCNQAYCDFIGYPKEEVIGHFHDVPMLDKTIDMHELIHKLDSENHIGSKSIEIDGVRKDGRLIYSDFVIYKFKEEDKEIIWSVVRDIGEKKRQETEILSTMIRSEEGERSRFAIELHDGLVPVLSTTLGYLHILRNETDKDKVVEYNDRIKQLLNESIKSIREISNNISPDILAKYGLVQAVRAFCEKLKPIYDIEFSIDTNLNGRTNEVIEFVMYRLLTELINNTIKYAKATAVRIKIIQEESTLKLTYTDNGIGFDYTAERNSAKGLGLINLENRIEKLGGQFSFISSKDKGVQVEATFKKTYL
ncbi:PAS domain S-box protein [Carboxylicivirga sp. M1479]|uniref:PAS domain S-box protein n=1 Tax=Carboxylicivirga sp. M1479 TaxID=2594476 RepID=UPI0011784447|nr:PAS domain S-box protein [Carboxylicivirga sp. M1479]TRX70633.1 PAS domain S-box protein [Carboxylicivirga sp. M1479]